MAMDTYLDPAGIPLNPAGQSMKDAERIKREQKRVRQIELRRLYLEGEQFTKRNEERAAALKVDPWEMAEHEKLHAYSTQIQDAVEYMANQMAESFQFSAENEDVQELILTALKSSPDLRGSYGQDDISLTNMVREALVAQDTPVQVRWDPVKQTAWCEFWESEQVEFIFDDRDRYKMVEVQRTQSVWDFTITGDPLRKKETVSWQLSGLGECMRLTWFDEEPPHEVEYLGIPFIPWLSLRAKAKSSKESRGESVITNQTLRAADRYNAVQQVGYLIARYNSHGNLAVVGDASHLKAQLDERINKDVADILMFPAGTSVATITLPTDPQMLEQQAETLVSAMYNSFGLVRVDQETVTGLGQVSGYALEILNRKTDGTFNQIRNQYIGDFRDLCDMILDLTAYKSTEEEDLGIGEDADDLPEEELATAIWDRLQTLDPQEMFPEAVRQYTIHLGTGYVVDRSQLREDFNAGLISREEYLRQSGYSNDEIKAISKELEKAKPKDPEAGLSANAIAASKQAIDDQNKRDRDPAAAPGAPDPAQQ